MTELILIAGFVLSGIFMLIFLVGFFRESQAGTVVGRKKPAQRSLTLEVLERSRRDHRAA